MLLPSKRNSWKEKKKRRNILSHLCYLSWRVRPSPLPNHPTPSNMAVPSAPAEKEREGASGHPTAFKIAFFSFFFFFFFIIYFPVFSFFSVRTRRPPSTARPPVSSALCDRLVVEEKKKKKSGGRKKRLFELDDSRRRRS